ncbi:MAG TPA: hypothetical protein VG893_01105 [Terracidiphilus sp.]|nr:hypothetical protein [Terracidiphilus sp.]
MKRTTWVLGAAVLASALGMGTLQAQAAEVGVYVGVRGPAAYVPPCPGPGYVWIAGYMANGYWIPGRWSFAGVRGGPVVRYDVHRDFRYERGFDRRFDRDHFRR